MNDVEVLVDFLDSLAADLLGEVAPLSLEDGASRSADVCVPVWRMARWFDVLSTRVIDGLAATDELWHSRGWTARSGYDPRGIGYRGLGTANGYTPGEIAAIPRLMTAEVLVYFHQAYERLRERLAAMTSAELHAPARGLGSDRTAYEWVRPVLMGCVACVGDVAGRKNAPSR